jgi:hypothetical protein
VTVTVVTSPRSSGPGGPGMVRGYLNLHVMERGPDHSFSNFHTADSCDNMSTKKYVHLSRPPVYIHFIVQTESDECEMSINKQEFAPHATA